MSTFAPARADHRARQSAGCADWSPAHHGRARAIRAAESPGADPARAADRAARPDRGSAHGLRRRSANATSLAQPRSRRLARRARRFAAGPVC